MLSRLAFSNARLVPAVARGAQTVSSSTSSSDPSPPPRPKRPIYPKPVRYGFIPEEWFTFFYPKTGVTGPYMFAASLATYLVSKEIYVLEHEYYSGLSVALVCIVGIKKLGPPLAAWLDKKVDEHEGLWKQFRIDTLKSFDDAIETEKKEQWRAEGQKLLMDAKKQNIQIQLEAAYRERLATVYSEVKRRLDYQVQILAIERRLGQRHMVRWVIDHVLKSITPDQEKATLQKCIADLQALAPRA